MSSQAVKCAAPAPRFCLRPLIVDIDAPYADPDTSPDPWWAARKHVRWERERKVKAERQCRRDSLIMPRFLIAIQLSSTPRCGQRKFFGNSLKSPLPSFLNPHPYTISQYFCSESTIPCPLSNRTDNSEHFLVGISRGTFEVFDWACEPRAYLWEPLGICELDLTLPRALDHRDIDYIERNLRHFARGLICGLVGFRG